MKRILIFNPLPPTRPRSTRLSTPLPTTCRLIDEAQHYRFGCAPLLFLALSLPPTFLLPNGPPQHPAGTKYDTAPYPTLQVVLDTSERAEIVE